MLISIRSLVPVLVAGTFIVGMQNNSLADATKLAPALASPWLSGCHDDLPIFGFSSRTICGVGEQVMRVRCRGLAANMGLERGDIILALNGMPLTFKGAWNHALRDAVCDGGWVQLEIEDVHTGRVAYRQTWVAGYRSVTRRQGMAGRQPPMVVSAVGPSTRNPQKAGSSPRGSRRNAKSEKDSNSWRRVTTLGDNNR